MNYEIGKKLKDSTTLKIGGPAARYYRPGSEEEIRSILLDAKECNAPICMLGKGSNVLFEDEGYDGWIIETITNFTGIKQLDPNRVEVLAGTTNEQLANWLAERGLGGFEFASGIPGTVGGAVIMNAGAYGGEIKDIIESCEWMDEDGNVHNTPAEELDLSYRHSMFSDRFGIVLKAVFQFEDRDKEDIYHAMDELNERRWTRQPMEMPSAGSTFKRPENGFASALIRECGLQGTSVNDAQVSEKHTGFLINRGQASCKDFLELVRIVQDEVYRKKGIHLEMEVHVIPKEGK